MTNLREFFLEQHAHSHAAALTSATEPTLSDQVLAGLVEAQLRLRPAPGLNSIAWLLWHIARCEDVMVGVLLTERGQILDEGGWLSRLDVARRDMGTGMDDAGVGEISARVEIAALLAYRAAVGRRTREVVADLPIESWDGPIEPARLLAARAFTDQADGARRVAGYWRGKTRRYVLTSSIATHSYQHLGEANCLKSMVKAI